MGERLPDSRYTSALRQGERKGVGDGSVTASCLRAAAYSEPVILGYRRLISHQRPIVLLPIVPETFKIAFKI